MSTPNPSEFARQTLWHLSLIRAEISEQSELLIGLSARGVGRSEKDLGELFVQQVNAQAEELYQQAIQAAGLEEGPDSPPLPPGRVANRRV
jgi:hypothetical protein